MGDLMRTVPVPRKGPGIARAGAAFVRPMRSFVMGWLACSVLVACHPSVPPSEPCAPSARDAALGALPARLAALDAGGVLGFAALHVESGKRVAVRGAQRFPMQSVFKVPVALALLANVDAGRERLEAEVAVGPADLRSGPSPDPLDPHAGGTYPVRELLRLMIQVSDNTATDLLVGRLGGPARVTSHLRAVGLEGIDVSRTEGELILEAHGVPYAAESAVRSTADRLIAAVPAPARRAASAAYLADPRDTATPDAMVGLLARLQKGELLSASSTRTLLDVMTGTKTGAKRLRAGLPEGVVLAHKTGTSDRFEELRDALGDVGLVVLPDGTHLALAAFVARSTKGDDQAERAIAEAARAAYEAFAGSGPGPSR